MNRDNAEMQAQRKHFRRSRGRRHILPIEKEGWTRFPPRVDNQLANSLYAPGLRAPGF